MKKVILFIAVLAIIGGGIGFYMYQKPHASMATMKVAVQATSQEIISAYQDDEDKANEAYLGKVISLEGEVQSIESNDQVTIVLKGNDMMSTVRCQMDHLTDHPQLDQLKPSDQVTLKGICTGYLMDVIFERCIIIHPS